MATEQKYTIGRNLSILYIAFTILSLFLKTSILGTLFLGIIFPIILLSLNRLLTKKYFFLHTNIFKITIVIIILSSFVPMLWLAILLPKAILPTLQNSTSLINPSQNLVSMYVISTQLLILLRGIVLIILAVLLIYKFKEFSKSLKIASLSLGILGILTVVAGMVGLFPKLFLLSQSIYISLNYGLTFLFPILYLFLFCSLFWEFRKTIEEPIGDIN